MTAISRVGPGSEFPVPDKSSQHCIGDRQVSASIVELETPVLVVGAPRNARDIDLVKIVLAGSFEISAKFGSWFL